MSIYLNIENKGGLFQKSYKIITDVINTYPIVRADFENNLALTLDTFSQYSCNDEYYDTYLKPFFKVKFATDTDEANRSIIYNLTDAYFISCAWYNELKLATKIKGNDYKELGRANACLATYINKLITKYKRGSSTNKNDLRDLNEAVGMSWLAYEDKVKKSLEYVPNFDEIEYHELVNTVLGQKLHLSPIYLERGIDGLH